MSDLVILIIGYAIVTVLSILIAARVRKHLNAFYALFTYIFVIIVSIYYVLDLILLRRPMVVDPFFYFWIGIILTQLFLLFYARTKYRNKQAKNDERSTP